VKGGEGKGDQAPQSKFLATPLGLSRQEFGLYPQVNSMSALLRTLLAQ